MRLLSDAEKCTGCRVCEAICSFVKSDAFNPKRSRIRVFSVEEAGLSVPLVCPSCDEPACAESCPVGAIQRDPRTGILIVDPETCNGCGMCVEACQYKAISWDLDGKIPQKCDLCGGDPECAKFCPTGAIAISELSIPESVLQYIRKVT